jgi:hypothetical protein
MRNRFRATSARGVALLIVLAALILIVTASVSFARLASTDRLRKSFNDRTLMADELLHASEAAIMHWLQEQSANALLPPDALLPAIEVLHDIIVTDRDSITIKIWAFDQCGMAPLEAVQAGLPIRLALPQEVMIAVDALTIDEKENLGLDLFSLPDGDDASELRIFPLCGESEPVTVGKSQPSPFQKIQEPVQTVCVGAHVATHNKSFINVNTAPIDLIDAAMRTAGRSGVEQIQVARAQGKPAVAPQTTSTNKDSDRIQIVGTSTIWSFRCDIFGGPRKRSWWMVYTKGSNTTKPWECVQRIAINE